MSSVQHIDLKIMNSTLPMRGSNVAGTFSEGADASTATGGSIAGSTQDRLIVGIDFGTTYSGGLSTRGKSRRARD
jgi:hypothetical protein